MREIARNVRVAALVGSLLLSLSARGNMGTEAAGDGISDEDYAAAQSAIEDKDYKKALDLLKKAQSRVGEHADLSNLLGYTSRKLGKLDDAFSHYNQALALNPKHKGAHAYVGEAYLMANNLAKAEEHLAALQRLCTPIPCLEMNDLKAEIEDFKARKK